MKMLSSRADWEKYWQSLQHQPQVIHQELLKNLQKITTVQGKKILEVGAGMAGDSLFLAQKGAQVVVLDFSQKALEKIKRSALRQKINLQTILADARNIPFPDGSFDIVFHQGFLEHIKDPHPYLLEQKRILKNKGILVVDVPQRFTTYTVKKHLEIFKKKWFAGWETEYSVGQLENLIRKEGFQIVSSYGWGYYGKLYQLRHLKLGKWYESVWKKIESSRLKLYLTFSIGVVAKKFD